MLAEENMNEKKNHTETLTLPEIFRSSDGTHYFAHVMNR